MKRPEQYFRAGVGAVILDDRGMVLVFERVDHAGQWQLPQGGLDDDEEPLDAVYREVCEETGIPRAALSLLRRLPDLLAYELPAHARSKKTGRGQVQYWFFFRLATLSPPIDIVPGKEFRAYRWATLDHLVSGAVEFRKAVYRRLAETARQF